MHCCLRYGFLFLCVLVALNSQLHAQSKERNFAQEVKDAPNDSIKIARIFDWDNHIYIQNPRLDIKLNNEVIEICRDKIKQKPKSKYYQESLSKALNNKGLAYTEKNKLDEALALLQESYEISKKFGFKETEGFTSNNIGTIYRSMKEHEKAIDYYSKSLAITKDSSETPETFNNIGLCYMDLNKNDLARHYFEISLRFSNIKTHPLNKANSLLNLADLYMNEGKDKDALNYFNKALETNQLISNYHGISYSYWKLCELNRLEKKYDLALSYGKKSLQIATEQDLLYNKKEATHQLYLTYKAKNDLKHALEFYELYTKYFDEYTAQTNKEDLIRKESAFEYKNKEKLAESKHRKEMEVAAEKNKRQNIILIFISLLLVAFLIFLAFIVKSFRKTRKMNAIIQLQKKEVEVKNKEIVDSINYAKRIQGAILPSEEDFHQTLKDAFILYLPKDIVAGDFYWMEKVNDLVLLAVADCTGHGVPGALVSVVCHNALNRCIHEYKLIEPAEILNRTRDLVIHEFQKSKEEVRDGMDISLCLIDFNNNRLKWAGANNPLWFIRNRQLQEWKADKQPIGSYSHKKEFTQHEMKLEKGDMIYLFSDGFSDQFGGSDELIQAKKFKSTRLKHLLMEIHEETPNEQKRLLQNAHRQWKGNLEQVDDICVIGLKI